MFVAGILTMAGGRLFDYLVTTTSTGSIASASEGHFLEFVVACIMSAIAVYFCMAGMFGFSPFRRATHALRRSPNANAIKKKTKSPKNDQADRDTLEAGDVFQVDLRVSWYLGEEERGHKYWGFVMKVESDKLVIEKITKGS